MLVLAFKKNIMKTFFSNFAFAFILMVNVVSANNMNQSEELKDHNKQTDSVTIAQCLPGLSGSLILSIAECLEINDLLTEEEKETDDIPFNTKAVVTKYYITKELKDKVIRSIPDNYVIEEEAEVNDITFDTKKIYYSIINDSIKIKVDEENEVDDIPFDTEEIYKKYMHI